MHNFFELVAQIDQVPVNESYVSQIESAYSCTLPEFLRHLVSLPYPSVDPNEDPGVDIMNVAQIVHAEEDYGYEFKDHGLLPVLNKADGLFACYDCQAKDWCLVHTSEDYIYKRSKSLIALL